MEKVLHLFDFDGTLTKQDSLFVFLRFCDAQHYQKIYQQFLPKFALAKFGMLPKAKVKESFIVACLQNKPLPELNKMASVFFEQQRILQQSAINKLFTIMRNEHEEAALVSASLDLWLTPFAKFFRMKLICTKAKYENNLLVGFDGENCNYEQKKIRIKQEFDLQAYDRIIAYGDSAGDKAMFSLAQETHYKPF